MSLVLFLLEIFIMEILKGSKIVQVDVKELIYNHFDLLSTSVYPETVPMLTLFVAVPLCENYNTNFSRSTQMKKIENFKKKIVERSKFQSGPFSLCVSEWVSEL